MKAIETITGPVSVLWRDDVDTDQIIPKQFLKRVERTGFGQFLFYDWRENEDWDLPSNPILATGRNFGCGSSREHAPWALDQYGFRAIIAPSYADIFFNNSFKNGLLPIVLSESQVAQLFDETLAFPGYSLTIDLERQVVIKPDGVELPFEVQAFRKYCLINGLDDIGLTLRHKDKIKAFEAERLAKKPWLSHQLIA